MQALVPDRRQLGRLQGPRRILECPNAGCQRRGCCHAVRRQLRRPRRRRCGPLVDPHSESRRVPWHPERLQRRAPGRGRCGALVQRSAVGLSVRRVCVALCRRDLDGPAKRVVAVRALWCDGDAAVVGRARRRAAARDVDRRGYPWYCATKFVRVLQCRVARRRDRVRPSSVQRPNRNRLPGPNCGDGTSSVCSLPGCQSKLGGAVMHSPHTMISISSTTRSARSSRTSVHGPRAPLLPMPALRWVARRLSRLVGRRRESDGPAAMWSPAFMAAAPGMSLARFRRNRSAKPVSGCFYRLRVRFQSLRRGRSQMSFLGLSERLFML